MSFREDIPNPFRSSSPGVNRNNKRARIEADTEALGIDALVDVQQRVRAPRVKLDEYRLLADNGIPALRQKARTLKLKGKGHEFSDASRLLSFYQEWLDNIFPKARFLDALAMVEKAGHKTILQNKRKEWIDEDKPKTSADKDEEYREPQSAEVAGPANVASIFSEAARNAKTPAPRDEEDLFEDDIYGASPRRLPNKAMEDVPDDDDLDAMMAEADAAAPAPTTKTLPSLFGSASSKPGAKSAAPDDFDDLDALLAEAEAETTRPMAPRIVPVTKAAGRQANDGLDELDALLAEAEAEISAKQSSSTKAVDGQKDETADADEEEAMAEMDGLW